MKSKIENLGMTTIRVGGSIWEALALFIIGGCLAAMFAGILLFAMLK